MQSVISGFTEWFEAHCSLQDHGEAAPTDPRLHPGLCAWSRACKYLFTYINLFFKSDGNTIS